MKKLLIPFAVFFLSFLTFNQAFAICPVCTIAVGAGVGLCRWLGIDDVLSGIWIGGLIVSMIGWTLGWLDKKQIHFNFRGLCVSLLFYAVVIVPLYFMGIIGHPLNTFWGIDKLILGIIFGSIAFLVGVGLNVFLKSKNQGKAFFPFQKVILPLLFLIVATFIFHKIVGCKLL
jgi:hypothetical protein